MGLFDLEKHFAFYGSYHSNPINIFIHTLFVWPIFFTALVLFYFTPPILNLSEFLFSGHGLIFNFGFVFTLIYALFYIGLDYKAGSLGAVLCFGCWVFASSLANSLGFSLAWKEVLIIWGDNDRIFLLEKAQQLKEILGGNVKLEVIKNAAHVPQLEHPEEFNNILKNYLCGL